jgi:hypothetical protein
VVAGVVGVLSAAFVAVRDVTHGGHLGSFALAGGTFVHAGAPADLPVRAASTGYDGQFYYRLALDPLTHQVTQFHITLDNPSYRQQRIGLPALAWLVHEAVRAPTSLALVLVNVVALVVLGFAGAGLAQQWNRSPWWGVALAVSPALVMALARDLTEPMATAGLVLGLLWWVRGRVWWAAGAFTVAVLCRETVLVLLFGMALWCLGQLVGGRGSRWGSATKVAALCVPAAIEISWQFYLKHVWGGPLPTRSGHGQVGIILVRPLRTLFVGADQIGPTHQGVLDAVWLLERFLLLALLVVVASGLMRSVAPTEIRLGWVFAALLAISVAWNQDVQFVRAANEAIVVGQLLLLARKDQIARVTAVGVAGWSAMVAVIYAAAL